MADPLDPAAPIEIIHGEVYLSRPFVVEPRRVKLGSEIAAELDLECDVALQLWSALAIILQVSTSLSIPLVPKMLPGSTRDCVEIRLRSIGVSWNLPIDRLDQEHPSMADLSRVKLGNGLVETEINWKLRQNSVILLRRVVRGVPQRHFIVVI